MFNIVCVKGLSSFGLTINAKNLKQAIARARVMMEGSGYSVQPLK